MVCFIRYLATTHFEPTDARNAFPCFDEPNMKAKFSVVITRERHHVALGNMPIQHTEGVRAAVTIYRLPCTPLYSTGQMGSCVQSCIKGTHGQGSTNASNQDTINSWATCTCTCQPTLCRHIGHHLVDGLLIVSQQNVIFSDPVTRHNVLINTMGDHMFNMYM